MVRCSCMERPETFNGCTFKQTSPNAYNVWTYGAKEVDFNDCIFECAGKSVLFTTRERFPVLT